MNLYELCKKSIPLYRSGDLAKHIYIEGVNMLALYTQKIVNELITRLTIIL